MRAGGTGRVRTIDFGRHDFAFGIALRIWAVVGGIIIGAAILNVFDVLAPVIEFLAVGSLVAFVAAPLVNALDQRGVPRGMAALLGLAVVIAVVALVLIIVAPLIFSQLWELAARIPDQLRGWGDWLSGFASDFRFLAKTQWASDLSSLVDAVADSAARNVAQIAGDLGRGVFPFLSNVGSQLFIVFLGLVLAFWLACDYPRMHREIGTILGEDHEMSYRFMVAILSRAVGGYMRSMVITSAIDGVLSLAGFALVGHPYALLMGVLTAIFHLIPVVGPVISSALAILVALFSSPGMALGTLLVCVVAQNVTDNVISPRVMQSAVSVHPAMSLTAIVIGSALMGPLGMVVAIPLCAALKGLFIFYFEKRTQRQIVSWDGAVFQGQPFHDADGAPVPAYDALGDDTFVSDSQLISAEAAPAAEAEPRPPEIDNPWAKLAALNNLQASGTGVFRNPFASDDAHQDGKDGGDAHDGGETS